MKCPKCKKEITEVWILTEFEQRGRLKGNKIISIGEMEEAEGLKEIQCPECGENIQDSVEE